MAKKEGGRGGRRRREGGGGGEEEEDKEEEEEEEEKEKDGKEKKREKERKKGPRMGQDGGTRESQQYSLSAFHKPLTETALQQEIEASKTGSSKCLCLTCPPPQGQSSTQIPSPGSQASQGTDVSRAQEVLLSETPAFLQGSLCHPWNLQAAIGVSL